MSAAMANEFSRDDVFPAPAQLGKLLDLDDSDKPINLLDWTLVDVWTSLFYCLTLLI